MKIARSLSSKFLVLALAGVGAAALATPAQADTHVNVGVSVGVPLPNGYARVSVGNDHYYYHRGTFYRPGPHGGYYVVHAPHGVIVHTLPPYYSRVYYGGVPYYYYSGVYYQSVPTGYMVVDPPAPGVVVGQPGTVVAPPPPAGTEAPIGSAPPPEARKDEAYQTVWVGDVQYQFKDGQFFKTTADGLIWTEAPLGAITKNLPQDAKSVWYQDNEYFECDDVYFRKTADGYKVVPAPWKK